MLNMNFKGITWVGNIYDKFEAICLDAEDIMSQDTVKYVENQVQNVGGNIKKFCAEFVNDLLPIEDPVKVKDSDKEATAELGACEKANLNSKSILKKESGPHNFLEVIAPVVKDAGLVSFLSGVPQINHLFPLASTSHVKEVVSDLSVKKSVVADKRKKTKVNVKDDHKEEIPPLQASSPVRIQVQDQLRSSSLAYPDDMSTLGLSQECNGSVGKCENSSGDMKGVSVKEYPEPVITDTSGGINSVGDLSSRETNFSRPCNENRDRACVTLKTILSQNSNKDIVDNSPDHGENMDHIMSGQSGRDANVSKAQFLPPVLLYENKAMEAGWTASNNSLLSGPNESPVNEGDQCKDEEQEVFLTPQPQPQLGTSDYEESAEWEKANDDVGNTADQEEHDAFNDGVGLEEANYAIGLDTKTIEQFENLKLEDSCVVVQPFSVSYRDGKNRSYKRKIRDAIASRMGSSKKKEYEQLAIWCADIDAESTQHRFETSSLATPKKLDSKISSSDEFCESEWEIL
ncbi:uncharacterized protein LOC113308360 isoform X2 [Papaver somniferum]|uniref:uncharacterized protein LOC113308360 isoform X2 n=1 Tax=Papaver somniferum TaxID=3469 RepID=UPI000E6F4824|nr:uncharacterized protein LOC113308360 isoform X2 [Papaver somniferum]